MFGLWSSLSGYDDYIGGYDDCGPDRGHWRDKSDAAIRRENQAKQLFDAFLQECNSMKTFPVTKEVVPPSMHLTDACWKTFKKYVVNKGCTTKGREATRQERIDSRDKRSGKLWVISVTCPIHPGQAIKAAQEKKAKAAAAAEKKAEKAKLAAEKAKLEAERKAKEAKALQAKIKEEYASIVSEIDENKKEVLKDHNTNESKSDTDEPAKKKLKLTKLSVPQDALLGHAEKIHRERAVDIARTIAAEKSEECQKLLSELDERMQAKEALQKKEAREYCDRIKSSIMELGGQ